MCGSLTFVAIRSTDTSTVAKASIGSLAALLTLGRWDNARAELAPRWELRPRRVRRERRNLGTLTVYVTGAACALLSQKAYLLFAFNRRRCCAAWLRRVKAGECRNRGPAAAAIGRKPQFDMRRREPPVRGWRCAPGAREVSRSHRASCAKARPASCLERRIRGPPDLAFVAGLKTMAPSVVARSCGRTDSSRSIIQEGAAPDLAPETGDDQPVSKDPWSASSSTASSRSTTATGPATTAVLIFYHRGLWCVGTLPVDEIAC